MGTHEERSTHKKDTLNPVWGEVLLEVPYPGSAASNPAAPSVELTVFDDHDGAILGRVSVPIAHVVHSMSEAPAAASGPEQPVASGSAVVANASRTLPIVKKVTPR